jgi:pyrroloquinoline-quinone synthase
MKALIERVLDDCGYRENPYFAALRDGSFAHDDFVETQAQFYFAVDFFSRPMAAVAAKIPEARCRVAVLRNVWEEHGEGDASLMHGATFLAFLERLAGIREEDLDRRALWPEVRMFNTTLVGAAVLDEYLVSVGMLGIIERMFSEISGWIGRAVVDRGWVEPDRMVHYTLHEALDVKHSDDFFEVLRPAWEAGPADRYYIEQGLRLGAAAFDGLYAGLWRGRARRWTASSRGHHSRA